MLALITNGVNNLYYLIMKQHLANFNSQLSAIMFKFDLGILMLILAPFVLLVEKFISQKNRGQLWRRAGCWIVRHVFKANDLQIIVKHPENISTTAAIYAVNHPSAMDGFLLFNVLGASAVLFIAPLEQFPQPLRFWLKKMGAIDVRRDPIDDRRYPDAETKKQAIERAVNAVRRGNSLIIFPEGHIELLRVLHYFHTGASRIALAGHTPIIPVSIINSDRAFPDEKHFFPIAPVIINFNKQLKPPSLASKQPPALAARRLRDILEKEIISNLPSRYLPDDYRHKTKKIGVFVDIDRTIYEGLSQKDLIAYLLWLNKIPAREAFRVFYWLFLEKLQKIKHAEMMRRALLILRGWDVAELRHDISRAFGKKLLANIQYGLFPILKDHAEENHSIVLVSEVIHPLANEFKNFLHARNSLDTRLETTHHCYTGRVHCLCYKEEKARLVQEFSARAGIDLGRSYAFGDSAADLPFLKIVRHPTAINPDQQLLNYAEKHQWPIIKNAG